MVEIIREPVRATYTYEESMEACVEFFNGDEMAAANVVNKYLLRDNRGHFLERSPADYLSKRLPSEFHRIEQQYPNSLSRDTIEEALFGFKRVCCQGSPTYGIGNPFQVVSLGNCFCVGGPYDSYGGILWKDEELAQIMKRRGGVGVDVSGIRPSGMPVKNSARTSDGLRVFVHRYSNTTKEVAQEGRRGALMISCDCRHPDIQTFIDLKRVKNAVTGANLSVKWHDDFMEAVEKDEEYVLRFPVTATPEKAEFTKTVRAKEVWEQFISANWGEGGKGGEPGGLFWDRIIRQSVSDCYSEQGFRTVGTNPCAELPLSEYAACILMFLNLTGFVKQPFKKRASFDWKAFEASARIAARLIDDLVDLEIEKVEQILDKVRSDPEPEVIKQREIRLWEKVLANYKNGRRTGLGVTGLGDMLAMLNIKYDSQEALDFVDKLFAKYQATVYDESAELAKERGPFPLWDWELEKDNHYIKQLPQATQDKIRKYGRRNIASLTIAPVGTMSTVAQTTSGIEPVYQIAYTRNKKMTPEEEAQGIQPSRVDDDGTKWLSFSVVHHGLQQWMDATGETEPKKSPYWGCDAESINWQQRVKMQATIQRYIDHSISSCLAVGNHMVATDMGLVYVEELVSGRENGEFSPLTAQCSTWNHKGVQAPISEGFCNGVAQCVRVEFEGMEDVVATPNHRLLVLGTDYVPLWKRMDEISVGDWVVGRIGLGAFGSTQRTIASIMGPFRTSLKAGKGNTKAVRTPRRVTAGLARLLGYITSDGGISVNGAFLSQQHNNAAEDFEKLILSVFGIEISWSRDWRADDLWGLVANSRILRDYLKYLGVRKGAHNKRVPKVIFQGAGRHNTAEFIRGLTLDGFVSEEKVGVMTTTSRRLAREVQLLLHQFGIEAGIVKNKAFDREFPGGRWHQCRKSYCVYCACGAAEKFVDLIGFAEERKQKEAKEKLRRPSRKYLQGDVPDFGMRQKLRLELLPELRSRRMYDWLHSFCGKSKYGLRIARESLLAVADLGFSVPELLLDETFRFLRVKRAIQAGAFPTFDLSVPDGNSYTVNGLVSHNTLNLPRTATKEDISAIYVAGWREGCKGLTVYRDGSREGVLVSNQTDLVEITPSMAPKRPDVLPCEIHYSSISKRRGKGTDKWIFFVGLLEGKVYEIFGGLREHLEIPRKYKTGWVVRNGQKREGKSVYHLYLGDLEDTDERLIVHDIATTFAPDPGSYTRMISLQLRHGVPIQHICDQLLKDSEAALFTFEKGIARVLKKYIAEGEKSGRLCPKCENQTLEYRSGCVYCTTPGCGWSACD